MMNLNKEILKPTIVALIIGIIGDVVYSSIGYLGFSILLPIIVFLLTVMFKNLQVRSRAAIVITTTICFATGIMLTFGLYQIRMHYFGDRSVSDTYGLIYLFGAIPSLLIGLLFSIYFTKYVRKLNEI